MTLTPQGVRRPEFHIPFDCAGNQVAAGLTRYLNVGGIVYGGSGGPQSDENNPIANWLVTKAGTMKNLIVWGDAAPGAGETYIFTVRVNQANSTLTATVSGTSRTATDVTNSVRVAVGDRVTIRIVSSAGAPADRPMASLLYIPD